MKNRNLPEGMIYWTYVLTWPFYFVGALYLAAPVVAWVMLFMVGLAAYLGPVIRDDLQLAGRVPSIVKLWFAGMFVMLFALWAGHLNWGLGLGQTIKSSIGWAKGWALIPIFMLVGACFSIRRDILIRGQNIVGLITLLLLPMFIVSPLIGMPSQLYISPLQATGGPGPEYFAVYLFTIDPESGGSRWQFYAPWSPFAGLLGVTMVIFAVEDRKKFWLISGLLGGLAMIFLSKSRMSLVGLAVCLIVPRLLPLIKDWRTWAAAKPLVASMAIFGASIWTFAFDAIDGFKRARASSSRVRDTIQSIGYQRWQTEAFWFGHGTVERGPHIVEFMPIGSHHTWYGLLFVKGLVGFLALLVPFISHLALVFKDAIFEPRGRLPLALLLNIMILTFGENLEIEVYLLWPVFVLLGIHLREMATE